MKSYLNCSNLIACVLYSKRVRVCSILKWYIHYYTFINSFYVQLSKADYNDTAIDVRDQFRWGGGGALRFLARTFSPMPARKSSGFAKILLGFLSQKIVTWKILGRLQSPPSPPHRTPMNMKKNEGMKKIHTTAKFSQHGFVLTFSALCIQENFTFLQSIYFLIAQ